jgi:hypothetical protein
MLFSPLQLDCSSHISHVLSRFRLHTTLDSSRPVRDHFLTLGIVRDDDFLVYFQIVPLKLIFYLSPFKFQNKNKKSKKNSFVFRRRKIEEEEEEEEE